MTSLGILSGQQCTDSATITPQDDAKNFDAISATRRPLRLRSASFQSFITCYHRCRQLRLGMPSRHTTYAALILIRELLPPLFYFSTPTPLYFISSCFNLSPRFISQYYQPIELRNARLFSPVYASLPFDTLTASAFTPDEMLFTMRLREAKMRDFAAHHIIRPRGTALYTAYLYVSATRISPLMRFSADFY